MVNYILHFRPLLKPFALWPFPVAVAEAGHIVAQPAVSASAAAPMSLYSDPVTNFNPSTVSPRPTTVPAYSCPIMLTVRQLLPKRLVYGVLNLFRIRRRIPLDQHIYRPGLGTSTCCTSSLFGPTSTTAFIFSGIVIFHLPCISKLKNCMRLSCGYKEALIPNAFSN